MTNEEWEECTILAQRPTRNVLESWRVGMMYVNGLHDLAHIVCRGLEKERNDALARVKELECLFDHIEDDLMKLRVLLLEDRIKKEKT